LRKRNDGELLKIRDNDREFTQENIFTFKNTIYRELKGKTQPKLLLVTFDQLLSV